MRKVILLLYATICFLGGFSQSYDKKIVEAMNSADWFTLFSLYQSESKDSPSDFLDTYSRFVIGNRFNRPEISISAFDELLDKYSGQLTVDQLVDCAIMCAIDLSRIGDNAKAASMLSAVRDGILKEGHTGAAGIMESFIRQYEALADYAPYIITIEGDKGTVPFAVVPVGRAESEGLHLHLEDSYINGFPADILFDTGAAVNVISASLIDKYDLIPIDVLTKVSGMGSHNGGFALAKEMKIGNITVKDVPFYVMEITSGNEKADQYMHSLNIIIGSDLMLHLKELTFDFEDSEISIPSLPPAPISSATPNLCFSPKMNLLARGTINAGDILMNVDTGDCSYGALGKSFYDRNRKFIKSTGTKTNIRKAGIGGVIISEGYAVPDMSLELGGGKATIPDMEIMVKTDYSGYDCNLGLKSLMLFRRVRFNLVDFVLTTGPKN